MLTQQQARALAHLANLLRPDWNEQGIYTALGRCQDREPFAAALATIRAARDPNARTPGVIPTDGPHWRELAGTEATPDEKGRPPKRHEECKIHAGRWADNCGGCAADKLAGDRTSAAELRRPDRSQALALARAELAQAKANLCPHGIARSRVKCGDCEMPNPTKPETATPESESADE